MRADDLPGTNHPLARRMGVIAFLSHNLTMACIFGSFGVLLVAVEKQLGVGRDVSALAIPCVTVISSVLAPVAGALVTRMSLRLLMMIGAGLAAAGFLMLAFTASVPAYLLAYGLLVGPGMCFCGAVLPSTLATRWFAVHRGRALGLIHVPLLVTAMPLVSAFMLRSYGLPSVYLLLAALMALNLVALNFIIDFPPSRIDPTGEDTAAEAQVDPGLTTGQLLGSGGFWALTLAMCAVVSTVVMLGTHIVPMATGWGVDPTTAASLLALYSFTGMLGTPTFGWLSDRIGGRTTLVILCVDIAIVLALLMLQPGFALLAVLVAVVGFHSAAIPACFGTALSQQFGTASFSRGYGLANLVNLPFIMLSVPIAGWVYVRTGGYAQDFLGHAVMLAAAGCLVLAVTAGRRARGVAGKGTTAHAA